MPVPGRAAPHPLELAQSLPVHIPVPPAQIAKGQCWPGQFSVESRDHDGALRMVVARLCLTIHSSFRLPGSVDTQAIDLTVFNLPGMFVST